MSRSKGKYDWVLLQDSTHLVPRTPAVPFDQFGWKCAIRCFGPYSRTWLAMFVHGSQKMTLTSWDLSFLFQLQWSSQPELRGGGGGSAGGSWGGGAGGEGEQASSIRGGRSTHSGEREMSILILIVGLWRAEDYTPVFSNQINYSLPIV